ASAGDAAYDHEENKQKERKREEINQARLIVRSLFGARLPFFGIDRHCLDDVIDTAADAAGEIVRPKARNNGVFCDELRYRIGECAFKAVTDLDAHLAFVRRHDKQRASVLLFLSDLPVTSELVTVVLNRGALERLECDYDQLSCGPGLELGQLALKGRFGRGVENSDFVNDATC